MTERRLGAHEVDSEIGGVVRSVCGPPRLEKAMR